MTLLNIPDYKDSPVITKKITKTYVDFSGAVLTKTISVFTVPANCRVQLVEAEVSQAFNGSLMISSVLSCGISGNNNKYLNVANVATVGTKNGVALSIPSLESRSSITDVQATLTIVGLNISGLTAGVVDIYITYIQLPA